MTALTERGTPLAHDLTPAATALEANLVTGLDAGEITTLKRTIDKIFANIGKTANAHEARSA